MAARICPFCGGELKAEVLGGLCPRCVLKQTAADEAQPQPAHGVDHDAPQIRSPKSEVRTCFGDYELVEKVAEGGMGVVYRARQLRLNRIVAVKMIQPGRVGSPEMVLRFRAEAEAAASLHHPNIVAIHETGECDGQHYFSMDYIEGQNLAEAVREGPLPSARAAQLLEKIAAAVHYAHQHKILHRDLKPSNVILDETGEPHVTDFGLAKRLTSDLGLRPSDLTLTGQVFGSPRFMPPEQASGRPGTVGVHSDVYGLGAILYYLLTGRPPFVGETMETTLAQVLEQEPVSPRLLNASVPRDLETICLKCLEKEPSRRYPTAQAVADELGRFLGNEPILARPVGLSGKAGRWCRRKPALATALGGVVLVAAVGFGGILAQWRRAVTSELFARQNAYAADMNLAQRALAANDLRLAVSLLDKYRPVGKPDIRHPKAKTDLRGWEWRYLWRLCQPEELVSLQTNVASISKAAVSLDRKVMAVQPDGSDKIVVWDLTGKRRRTELRLAGLVRSLALSPTGSLLAIGVGDVPGPPMVEVLDTQARNTVVTLSPSFPVRSLAFSPDAKLLATFEDDGTAKVIEWESNRVLAQITNASPRRLQAGIVVFSPDGRRLGIGGDYGTIQILDWRTGSRVTNQREPDNGVMALAFSPDSEHLAVGLGYASRTVWMYAASSGELVGQLPNSAAFLRALAFSPDGQRLAAVSNDDSIRIWNLAARTEMHRLQGHPGEGLALAFLADNRTLVSGCRKGTACFWDSALTNRVPAHTNLAISHWPTRTNASAPSSPRAEGAAPKPICRLGLAFTPDSRSFITTIPAGMLGIWDASSLQPKASLPFVGSNCWQVALSSNGQWLAVGDVSGKVHIWDWKARQRVQSFDLPFEWCGGLRFSPRGKFLLGRVRFDNFMLEHKIWQNRGSWEELTLEAMHLKGLTAADISPDDRLLALAYNNGTITLRNMTSGQVEATFGQGSIRVNEVRFSPDGRVLATTGADGTVRLWDVFARRELAIMHAHSGGAWDAAFTPDGRRLATGSSSPEDAVRLWDIATQRELLTFEADGRYFAHVTFSPDGNTLMATSIEGLAHFWRAPSWAEIEAAEKGTVTP